MVEIRLGESGKLLCVEGHGSRRAVSQAFEKLQTFITDKRVPVKGERLTIIYDQPELLNNEQLHFAAAVELAGDVFGDGEVLIITQAMMKIACQVHQGQFSTIQETYQSLINWIPEQGYEMVGPAREYELSHDPCLIEIQIPVEKKA